MPKPLRTPAPPAQAVHVIDPRAVYTLATARAALGLRENTLPREIRARRLRAAKRAGRIFILGGWLLEWIQGGELARRRLDPVAAGERETWEGGAE